MKPGIHVYNLPASDLVALAREADERGFDSIWLGEHIVIPAEHSSEHPGRATQTGTVHAPILELDTDIHDPWVALGAIAASTSRIGVGFGVYLLPLRHPLLTASAAASAFDFSGGRFSLGTGTGWLAEEFAALDVPFGGRGDRVDETIDVLRAAWAGGVFEHRGELFQIDALQVTNHPTPVPLIVGGNSARAMARAVAVGDGWMASGTPSIDQAISLRANLERRLRTAGHDRPFRCVVRAEDAERATVERYADAGFDEVVFHINRSVADRAGGWRGWLDSISDAVATHLRSAAVPALHAS